MRLKHSVFLAFIAVLVVVSPVLAAAYSAPYTITETSSNAYTMLPVSVDVDNQWLADNGFMGSDALDTRVETLGGLERPHMVADDRTLTSVAVPANSQTNLYFTTGNSDLTAMDIIAGYDGYCTIFDAAGLELANDFLIEIAGYIDTSSGSDKNLVYKQDAFRIYVSGATNITSYIIGSTQQNSANTFTALYSGSNTMAGQRSNSFPATTIREVSFLLTKNGTPTGTVYARIRSVSGDTLLGTVGQINANIVTGSEVWYVFNTTAVVVPSVQDIRIVVEYSGGSSGNPIRAFYQSTDVATGVHTVYDGSWTDGGTNDAAYRILYDAVSVTATGVSSGEHIVKVGIKEK